MIPKELTDSIIAVMWKGIECELRGVGIVPLLRVWSFEGERRRLEPIQHYRDDEKIRKKPKVSSFDSKVIKKYF